MGHTEDPHHMRYAESYQKNDRITMGMTGPPFLLSDQASTWDSERKFRSSGRLVSQVSAILPRESETKGHIE
jgi:hypothetical protein